MIDEGQEKEIKKKILEKHLAQLDHHKGQVEHLKRIVEALQYDLGIEAPIEIGATPNLPKMPSPETGSSARIRADEFFSMKQTEAAYAYLKKVGYAVHIDQILQALQAGGVKLGGKNPKATLYTSLVRGTKRFVLVSPSTFGLAEFYPNRKIGEKDKEK